MHVPLSGACQPQRLSDRPTDTFPRLSTTTRRKKRVCVCVCLAQQAESRAPPSYAMHRYRSTLPTSPTYHDAPRLKTKTKTKTKTLRVRWDRQGSSTK